MKRLLAFALAFIMCLTIIPADTVFAQGEEVEQTIPENVQEKISEEMPAEVNQTAQEEIPEEVEQLQLPLNYVVVDKGYLQAGEEQNVVVSIGDGENYASDAVLEYKNETTGEIYQIEAVAIVEDGLLFHPVTQAQGVYTLIAIHYTVAEQSETIVLEEMGVKASYGVNVETENEADAFIVDEADIIDANDVEYNVVRLDENGNEISELTIEDALANATEEQTEENQFEAKTYKSNGNLIVVLDPGHGGSDPGACRTINGVTYYERDINLKIAQYCKAELEQYSGVTVYMTRTDNTSTLMNRLERTEYALSVGADVIVSLHINATGADTQTSAGGALVYCPNTDTESGEISQELATVILEKLAELGLENRGNVVDEGLGMIMYPKQNGVPGILVEHAFINNPEDVANYLSSDEKLKALGVADATAIAKYYRLQKGPSFKWTILGNSNVKIGNTAQLYYAVTEPAKITIQVYDKKNNFLKTIVSNKAVGTNDQVAVWDLTDKAGNYVIDGTYRLTITAVTSAGEKVVAHKYFNVIGNAPLSYKWAILSADRVKVGNNSQLYYAVNKKANITVQVYDGNDNFLKTIVSNKTVGTNDQVIIWDLTDKAGNYVTDGTYRYTITATTDAGEKVITHKWFKATGNEPLKYKWTTLGAASVKIGSAANLYYAVNKNANINVEILDAKGAVVRTLLTNKRVGTNDQVIRWDLKDTNGYDAENGTYYFKIDATNEMGEAISTKVQFKVTGNEPLSYKWTTLNTSTVKGGSNISLYYAVNKKADITVQVYHGNNSFLKTIVSNKAVGTNDQVVTWDLKNKDGLYVEPGQYRFTITAVGENGSKIVAHKYFTVSNYGIMGTSNTTVEKMVAFYNSRYTYPEFYADSEAPTIEDFCQIYFEECAAEGVRAEVAFCQSMKETGFLQYPGATCVVDPSQYNFAGLDTTGAVLKDEDGNPILDEEGNPKVDVGRSYSGVREGIRAHVQRLKAYAVKGTTPDSFAYECIDSDKYTNWWVNTIVGSAPYVEWLGKSQNPSGYGWATDPNYGYSIVNDYMRKLLSF